MTDCRRQSHREEVGLRVEIVLARFVDDSYELVLLGVGIEQAAIELAALKRRLIARVVDADDELGAG